MSLDFTLCEEVVNFNITHNLTTMAEKAGIYKILWRPQENGYFRAQDILPELKQGIHKMIKEADYFKQFEAENGWGTYNNFLPWLIDVYTACVENPESLISVCV